MVRRIVSRRSHFVKLAHRLNRLELIERMAEQPAGKPINEIAGNLINHNRGSQPLGDLRTILLTYTKHNETETKILEVE